jgi:phage I-like protein
LPQMLASTWNGGMPLLNRMLWAKLDSLPRALFGKLMARLLSHSFLMQATDDKLKRLSELNALRAKPIDMNKRLHAIAAKSVHNAFHHEVLAYSQKVNAVELEQFLVKRIAELAQLMDENIVE